MHLRAVVLLALPTLLLSQSQEEPTAQAGATQQEAVQTRMAGPETATGPGHWSRCPERRHAADTQRQERRHQEQSQQRAGDSESYRSEKPSYSSDTHHSEEHVPYHPSYAAMPYSASVPAFGYLPHPRRTYYEGASVNYPYQHSASQYHYQVPSY